MGWGDFIIRPAVFLFCGPYMGHLLFEDLLILILYRGWSWVTSGLFLFIQVRCIEAGTLGLCCFFILHG